MIRVGLGKGETPAMASARVVALAFLMIAGSVAPLRAQAPWASAPPECAAQFTALRSQVEKTGMAAKAGADNRVSRQELCKLVNAFRLRRPSG